MIAHESLAIAHTAIPAWAWDVVSRTSAPNGAETVSRTAGALLPGERRRLIEERLREQGSVSVAALEAEFAISPMTARRDLVELEKQGVARRTHGGAILPGLSSHEDSFFKRLEVAVEEKERLADAALAQVSPGDALFVDCSTTAYFAARRLVRDNFRCTLLTNAVPVMELVCESDAPQVELIGMGGTLRKLTRSFVGPQAVAGIETHFADQVVFSVAGLTDQGHLTDPDPLEAEVKRAMIRRARRAVLLVDNSKFDHAALSVIADVSAVDAVLAAGAPDRALRPLRRAGVDVTAV
jgi:DeoR/GlpR family transcriptional regulator of sugar metabolism